MALKSGWHEFQSESKKKFLNYGIKRAKIWSGSEDYYKILGGEKNVMNDERLNGVLMYRFTVWPTLHQRPLLLSCLFLYFTVFVSFP
jgi:hypothetical protein